MPPAEPGLADKVVRLHAMLGRAGVEHAFGGALALAYYAEPRATIDIDLNVFVPPDQAGRVLGMMRRLGVDVGSAAGRIADEGLARVWWGRTPLDLFFAYDDLHEAMRSRTRTVPFGEDEIPILAPEHLLVAKAVFDRPKDWIDIEHMLLATPGLDRVEVHRWLGHLVGTDDPRFERVVALEHHVLGGG